MSEQAFHEHYMGLALREAQAAAEAGEVPAGCIIVALPTDADVGSLYDTHAARIVARAHNQTESLKDPTAHAEMIAITQAASALGDWRLTRCILYVTKEPCPMCAGGIVLARIPLVVWGFSDALRGGISQFGILTSTTLNHRPALLSGILEAPCKTQFQSFFKSRRAENAQAASIVEDEG